MTDENEVEETTIKITLDEVIKLLDKKYDLVYVDYRDSLDDSLEQIQKAIQKQDWEPLDECINDDWMSDQRYDSAMQIIEDLKDEIISAFDIEDTDDQTAEEIVDEWLEDSDPEDKYHTDNKDLLRYEIEERDESTPLDDLLRNTSDPVFFYDLGVDIEEAWYDGDLSKEMFRTVKKALGIKMRDKTWDADLELMLAQASYGGRLVIYFRMPITDWLFFRNRDEVTPDTVTFEDPIVAIIDNGNGSGDHTGLPGLTLKVPLDFTRVFIDKCTHYSYVYEVCGLVGSFADCTNVKFSKTNTRKKLGRSTLGDEMDIQEKYEAVYKAGGCTAGDMKMSRHRNTVYINQYPCGTHCKDCGTFWVD